eukprot:scaffold527408_cov39-Prasinocladus_malaysianus.AAC.1
MHLLPVVEHILAASQRSAQSEKLAQDQMAREPASSIVLIMQEFPAAQAPTELRSSRGTAKVKAATDDLLR